MNKSEIEVWKKHPDIKKIEVSSFGRVRSVKGHYYKISSTNSGYLQVEFRVNGKRIHKYVHRLVAEAFIQNKNNMPQVNHKDNDRTNNNVSNLEWCTISYNAKYREKFGISSIESQGHPLFAINLSTLEVSRFRSQHEASRSLGFSQGNIGAVIRGEMKQTCGFWFVNDDGNAVDVVKSKLHDIGKTGLKIKYREALKMH